MTKCITFISGELFLCHKMTLLAFFGFHIISFRNDFNKVAFQTEFWIELFLGLIQCLIEKSKRIEQTGTHPIHPILKPSIPKHPLKWKLVECLYSGHALMIKCKGVFTSFSILIYHLCSTDNTAATELIFFIEKREEPVSL